MAKDALARFPTPTTLTEWTRFADAVEVNEGENACIVQAAKILMAEKVVMQAAKSLDLACLFKQEGLIRAMCLLLSQSPAVWERMIVEGLCVSKLMLTRTCKWFQTFDEDAKAKFVPELKTSSKKSDRIASVLRAIFLNTVYFTNIVSVHSRGFLIDDKAPLLMLACTMPTLFHRTSVAHRLMFEGKAIDELMFKALRHDMDGAFCTMNIFQAFRRLMAKKSTRVDPTEYAQRFVLLIYSAKGGSIASLIDEILKLFANRVDIENILFGMKKCIDSMSPRFKSMLWEHQAWPADTMQRIATFDYGRESGVLGYFMHDADFMVSIVGAHRIASFVLHNYDQLEPKVRVARLVLETQVCAFMPTDFLLERIVPELVAHCSKETRLRVFSWAPVSVFDAMLVSCEAHHVIQCLNNVALRCDEHRMLTQLMMREGAGQVKYLMTKYRSDLRDTFVMSIVIDVAHSLDILLSETCHNPKKRKRGLAYYHPSGYEHSNAFQKLASDDDDIPESFWCDLQPIVHV